MCKGLSCVELVQWGLGDVPEWSRDYWPKDVAGPRFYPSPLLLTSSRSSLLFLCVPLQCSQMPRTRFSGSLRLSKNSFELRIAALAYFVFGF